VPEIEALLDKIELCLDGAMVTPLF